jgi:hypothetical protein
MLLRAIVALLALALAGLTTWVGVTLLGDASLPKWLRSGGALLIVGGGLGGLVVALRWIEGTVRS